MLENWGRIQKLKRKGWKIGSNVVIEDGCVLEASIGSIGDDVYIGNGCVIRAERVKIGNNCLLFPKLCVVVKKSFILGDRGKIGRNTTIRAYSVYIGKEFWCNENAEVGGGGWEKPTAILRIGDNVLMGKGASINVCKPVTIGSCTGIGIDCMIFTHSSGNGQSILKGYKHIELPVSIGDHVSVFTRAIIAPGSVVKNGVTIAALAFLSGDTEEKCLYAGIPAKRMKRTKSIPEEGWRSVLKKALENEGCQSIDEGSLVVNTKISNQILLTDKLTEAKAASFRKRGGSVIICKESCTHKENNLAIFDISQKKVSGCTTDFSEKVRNALRRNGIMFSYENYLPYKLSYKDLVERGIERI